MNITQWNRFCEKHGYKKLEVIHNNGTQVYIAEKLRSDTHLPTWDMRWAVGLGERMDVVRNIDVPAYLPDGKLVLESDRKALAEKDANEFLAKCKRVQRWKR